ncbi:hypothetical protein [Streptomyces coffeae]|uniref:Uncharacterized protein n=1 Tax=Streptomyces coffeae TaxID=621382 RepID=A0ABS1NNX8_9ACTN|nr:hypothetical protein [Streptomyces coffeae]MBL1101796.1 hypothetical protein [Streptomyces coffeae]
MRTRLQTLCDRLLESVAPKATASAVSCWQFDYCSRNACGTNRHRRYEVDPCNDRFRSCCPGSCSYSGRPCS